MFLYTVGGAGIVSATALACRRSPNKSFEMPVMVIFEVSDGRISAWRDYFDTKQFATRMG